MTEASPRQSAKIYQFPSGGRAGLGAQQQAAKAAREMLTRAPAVSFGPAYHDAAIEAEQARKR